MISHTPAPWKARLTTDTTYVVGHNEGPGDPIVCEISRHFSQSPEQVAEAEANAKLIAAAPDMLEALKRLLREADDCITIGGVEDALAAIARAEGRVE